MKPLSVNTLTDNTGAHCRKSRTRTRHLLPGIAASLVLAGNSAFATSTGVAIQPKIVPLEPLANQPAPTVFTITNYESGAVALGAVELSGDLAGAFSLSSNSCDNATLAANATCSVSVQYTYDSGSQPSRNAMVTVNVPDSSGNTLASALMTSGESDPDAAARRLPPVITDLTISPALAVGSASTITWKMMDYQNDTRSELAIFKCASSPAETDCGNSYASKAATSGVIAQASETSGSWTYGNATAKERTFSHVYTPDTAGTIVLRFYQKSGKDQAAGMPGTSLLIPGGLAGEGTAFGYHDKEGRRISATVN